MPPEKKKKLAQHSDDSEDAEIHKTYEEEDLSARTQQSSGGTKEAIKFDEYMEGGIPDSLLKGLGFSESGQPSADDGSEAEAEAEPAPNDSSFLHKDHESGNEDEGADQDNDGEDAEDEDYYERVPPRVVTKRKRGRPPGKSTPRGLKHSSPGRRTSGKSPGSHPKAIIRGNIMYERTETGEVIASLIKNGPNDDEGGRTFSGRLDGYPAEARGSGSSTAVLNELPSNCPIDENNVEEILNRSIEETNTMRMLLATLKDDLRRMGGGPNMTPYLKPVHVKRRTEIAEQLLKVYVNYQTNINNISKMNRNPLSHVFPGNWTPVERASPSVRAPRGGGRGARRAVAVESPSTPAVGSQVAASGAKKQAPVNNDGNVSNDLWMSCEPGSDDEGVARKGGMPKRKKQHSQDKSTVDAQVD